MFHLRLRDAMDICGYEFVWYTIKGDDRFDDSPYTALCVLGDLRSCRGHDSSQQPQVRLISTVLIQLALLQWSISFVTTTRADMK